MSVPAAYLGIVLIWGTTPLAIKWSGEGVGYLFGVTGPDGDRRHPGAVGTAPDRSALGLA